MFFFLLNQKYKQYNFYETYQIKSDLINFILTNKGERIENPEFGCDVWRVIFEQIDSEIIENTIETYIMDAVSIWLPYLKINEII